MTSARASVGLRPVTPDEAALVSDVALRSYRQHYLHLWHDGGAWYMQHSFDPAVLRADMAHPNHRYFLVYQADTPVGFVKLKIDQPLPGDDTRNALELERIYLIREATGRGVGSAVLEQLVTFAAGLGKERLWLKAMDSSTDAIAFYERNGFIRCGTHQLDFPVMKPAYRGMVILYRQVSIIDR